jgi:hypothetical protein
MYSPLMTCEYPHGNLSPNEFCPRCGEKQPEKAQQSTGFMKFGVEIGVPGYQEKFVTESQQISKVAVYLARTSYSFAVINLIVGVILSVMTSTSTQTYTLFGVSQDITVTTHPYQQAGWALLSSFLLMLMIGTFFRYIALQATYRGIQIAGSLSGLSDSLNANKK